MARNRIRQRWLLIIVSVGLSFALRLQAQFGPLSSREQAPQARSQDELDEYLRIGANANADELLRDAGVFISHYPHSEFLGALYQQEMHAYEQLGEFDETLAAGRKALDANPNNVSTLLTLAPDIANYVSQHRERIDLLALAEEYANRALEGIAKIRLPQQTPLKRWESEERELQSQAHETLGVTALVRGRTSMSINELQLSIQLTANPLGAQYMRLALALVSAGNTAKAKECFHHAAELGPDAVRRLALAHLEKLSHNTERP